MQNSLSQLSVRGDKNVSFLIYGGQLSRGSFQLSGSGDQSVPFVSAVSQVPLAESNP